MADTAGFLYSNFLLALRIQAITQLFCSALVKLWHLPGNVFVRIKWGEIYNMVPAAADAAKSLQLCPTLCDPIDGSPPVSPIPGILQARTLDWVAISFSNAWKWKVKVKSLSSVRLLATPWTASMPGFSVLHHLSELAQTHVHWVTDSIQPSRPQLSHSPPAFNLSQHQGIFQWVSSLHQAAKVLQLQLLHQSFQWIFRIDFL